MTKIQNSKQKGVSIYLTLMIMAILMAISLGISALLLGQMEMIRRMGDSVIAFYAADTGIERELYEANPPPYNYSGYLDLNGNGVQDSQDASYNVFVIEPGSDCAGSSYCLRSIGVYKTTRRAIEVTR